MTAHRERAGFYAAVIAMWIFLVIQALHAPIVAGDWNALAWLRHHALGLSSISQDRPLLLVLNGARWIHLVATPMVELALVPLAFTLAFGRWPRATLRDLELLVVLQLMIFLVVPTAAAVYFERPFATRELWPLVAMLALFAPYRIASDRPRSWLVPIVFALGGCAGLANEHAGPIAILVMIWLVWSAARAQRLRAWMIAGALGLVLGFVFARGQDAGARGSPLELVADAQLAIDGVVIALLIALSRAKLPELARTTQLAIGAVLAVAGGLVVTRLAWPSDQLSFAPAVLVACALTLTIDWILADRALGRVLMIACTLLLGYFAVRFLVGQARRYEENQHRIEILEAAKPNTIAKIPPYAGEGSRWSWGDDFESARLREYVANEVYDLNGIEYDRLLRWAEPMPPERFIAIATFDPPLTPDDQPKLAQRYIPTFPEDALAQLRHGPLVAIPGHKLVHYTVDVVGSQLDDPAARPVHAFEWAPDALTFVRGRPFDDRAGHAYVKVDPASAPATIKAAFVVGCGRTRRVVPEPGLLIPIALDCRGSFTAYLCDAGACWLAGRTWR